jgi:hypothetical protein
LKGSFLRGVEIACQQAEIIDNNLPVYPTQTLAQQAICGGVRNNQILSDRPTPTNGISVTKLYTSNRKLLN